MFFNGQTLICVEDFSFFKKGEKYYCTHVSSGHFFLTNNFTDFNVISIKVPFGLAEKFRIKS
jgi:hypothetical protein